MKMEFILQNEEVNLSKIIESEINNKCKKMYILAGVVKETGFNIIEESIIDSGVKLTMIIGVDKKNTTKLLLDNILLYTKDVYVYNNNNEKEFESNIFVFEHDKQSNVYITSNNISESGLESDMSVITKVTYDLNSIEEKKEYKNNLKVLLNVKENNFIKLDKHVITSFIQDKVIFSNKQYEHNVKSISEFLGKKEIKEEKKGSNFFEDILDLNIELPKIDLDISDFDIDISDAAKDEIKEQKKVKKFVTEEKDVQYNNFTDNEFEDLKEVNSDNLTDESFNDTLDLNSMLLTKSEVKLSEKRINNKYEEKEINKEDISESNDFKQPEVVKVKKIDLNNVSNYIFELASKQSNGQDLDVLKIPNYIRELIPNFFEFDKAKSIEIGQSEYRSKDITLEIVDAKNNEKYIDKNAKMMQKKGQTFMVFKSDILTNLPFAERDIARIIKLTGEVYHIEIVSKDLQEYKIWSKIMNKKLKGVERKYGIM